MVIAADGVRLPWEGRTVLIADDVHGIRHTLQRQLTRSFAGARILTAATPEEFEEFLRAHDVDVILVDYRFGAANGLRLIMRLDAQGFKGSRILMSAYTDLPLDPTGLGRVGVDAIVRKPFHVTMMVHVLALMLARSPEVRARSRACGAFLIVEEESFFAHVPERIPGGPRFCGNGHKNGPSMKYCGECGAPLTRAVDFAPGRSYDPDLAADFLFTLADEPALADRFRSAMGPARRAT